VTQYPHLFSPLDIGNATVRNRLMQTAHGKAYSVRNLVSQRDYDYKVARAAGGVGLMITGSRPVHPTGAQRGATLAYLHEGIPYDRRLTAAIQGYGAVIFGQLAHVGMMMPSDANDDPRVLWSASAIPSPHPSEMAKAMEPEEMDELVESYRSSAEIIRTGGYQGVELHFAHSYLIHQFLSSMFNRRTDEYGGPVENRLRLPMRIIESVRSAVGPDYVVGVRLGMTDFLEGAHDVSDTIAIVTALRDSGYIDYVSLSAAGFNKGLEIAPSDVPSGHMVAMAADIKAAVPGLVTFAIGGLNDPAQAEEMVRTGQADMVAMTRTMIADPEYPNKVREGRENEVYRCIRANQGCISRVFRGLAVACTVNPATGREGKFGARSLKLTAAPHRWLVVGGGPAGLKAAEGLGRAGHRVLLLEAEDRLGGQVNLAMETPGRETFGWIVTDLHNHLEKLGVEVRLGVRATAELVAQENPHGVVIATGALPGRDGYSYAAPLTRRIPGAELPHVVTPWEVLGSPFPWIRRQAFWPTPSGSTGKRASCAVPVRCWNHAWPTMASGWRGWNLPTTNSCSTGAVPLRISNRPSWRNWRTNSVNWTWCAPALQSPRSYPRLPGRFSFTAPEDSGCWWGATADRTTASVSRRRAGVTSGFMRRKHRAATWCSRSVKPLGRTRGICKPQPTWRLISVVHGATAPLRW